MPAETKAYKGMGMEGWIAKWYAANTGKDSRATSPHRRANWPRARAGICGARNCSRSRLFRDRACPRRKFRITGLDISATFVELARKNAAAARVEVEFLRGDAAHMPFESQHLRRDLLPRRVQEFFPTGAGAQGNVPRAQAGRDRGDHRSPPRRIQ